MKNNKTKAITIAALVIAVVALSIGFAAFASTLSISSSANVNPLNTFSVKFASGASIDGGILSYNVTPDVPVQKTASQGAQAGTPTIDNTNNPTIGNLSASFTRPGESVQYTFYVVNDGNYDAYLTNVVFKNASGAASFRNCVATGDNPVSTQIMNNICVTNNNITLTMNIGSQNDITGTTTLSNHLLSKNTFETVTVTIAYTGEIYADGSFDVSFGDIELHYSTVDEPEVAT